MSLQNNALDETLPTSWHDRISNAAELEITTYASPAIGFGRPDIGVRILHKPTGVIATCNTERSQYRNKEIAMRDLVKQLDLNRIMPTEKPMSRTVPTKAQVVKIIETATTNWLTSAINKLNVKLLEPTFVVSELQEANRSGEHDYWVITVEGEASPGDKKAMFELLYEAGWRDTTIENHGSTTEITLYNDVR